MALADRIKKSEPKIVAYLEDFVKFVENSYSMFPETWIQNELDNVQREIYSALYKLKYLK